MCRGHCERRRDAGQTRSGTRSCVPGSGRSGLIFGRRNVASRRSDEHRDSGAARSEPDGTAFLQQLICPVSAKVAAMIWMLRSKASRRTARIDVAAAAAMLREQLIVVRDVTEALGAGVPEWDGARARAEVTHEQFVSAVSRLPDWNGNSPLNGSTRPR